MPASTFAGWRVLPALAALVCAALLPAPTYAQSFSSYLGGWSYVDRNNDGVLNFSNDPNPEIVIGGVEINLYKHNGVDYIQIASTATDPYGRYQFGQLDAGRYKIEQVQPVGWVDGKDTAGVLLAINDQSVPPGSNVGVSGNNFVTDIQLTNNTIGEFYNFGERGLAAGYVSKRFLFASTPSNPFGEPVPEPTTLAMIVGVGVGLLTAPRRR
ncbi:SdrD B-like domain-containing protein [Botrimarina mediterranea]|uniref:Uro-adherence factor A n=1 Tax=Botrimarina mediterranea TaxID=2528022 RepID=A0A518KAE9_9BACT|nr:SdrD B-like domain-containing protein [Botrimarina mediterranea]QDV74758.1 Uro-adherence factor A precursor [Botrimarina mediterranea]QDV79403.1 Uro-adherence factor A precursor [Planctomycetes bacterium K2D]